MNNKLIIAIVVLCVGMQTGVTFGAQAPAPQGWGEWAYGKYAAAWDYVSPYYNRMQRVASEQLGVLYQAAQKEAGALGEVLVAAAKKEAEAMLPKIQEALIKGDFDGARAIAINAGNNFKAVAQKGADNSAQNAQRELKLVAQGAFDKMLIDTITQIDAAKLATMKQ